MKLTDHVEHIRQLIDQAFNNRLGRMGLYSGQVLPIESIPAEYKNELGVPYLHFPLDKTELRR